MALAAVVLLGLLLELLFVADNAVVASGAALLGGKVVIVLVIFVEVDILGAGVNGARFSLGSCLGLLLALALLFMLLKRMRVGILLGSSGLRGLFLCSLFLGSLLLGSFFLRSLFLRGTLCAPGSRSSLRLCCFLLLFRGLRLLRHGEVLVEVLDLVGLGDGLKENVQLVVREGCHGFLGGIPQFFQQVGDLFCGAAKVLGHVVYSVFIIYH